MIRLWRQHSCDLSLVGNADQMPLTFDLPYKHSVDMKGVKTVSMRTTGHEKRQAAENEVDDDGDVYYDATEDAVTINDMQRILDTDSEQEFLGFE